MRKFNEIAEECDMRYNELKYRYQLKIVPAKETEGCFLINKGLYALLLYFSLKINEITLKFKNEL
jgi:hypothetical protein